MKKGYIIGIVLLVILVIAIYYYNQNNKQEKSVSKSVSRNGQWQTISYTLPTNVDPEYFGKFYWSAIHDMASRIPCSACRTKWESFTKFGHDSVNFRLGKNLYDENNFKNWLDYFNEVREQRLKKLK